VKRFLPAILFVWVLAASCAEYSADHVSTALEIITPEAILEDTAALSADEMLGRRAGTEGEERAVAYIQSRFQAAGLEPIAGSYTQEIEIVSMRRVDDRSSLRIRRNSQTLEFQPEQTLTYWSTAQKPVVEIQDAPLLFVGYGVQAPEYGWDDFKGADVAGKVLLFLNDDPPVVEDGRALFEGERRTYYGRWTYKFEQAMRLGAAGAFVIHTAPSAGYPFSVIQYAGGREQFEVKLPGSGYQVDLVGWIDEATSEWIAQEMGATLEGLFESGARRDFEPVDTGFRVSARIETDIQEVMTRNVYGLLEGSDPELKDQMIVFSAHYDHLGVDENVEGPDKIFNGAWDNASGTACVLNLADAFASLPERPRRSILFLACGAEEGGILGSKWFVERPPFERSRMIANFNIDMTQIFGLTWDIAAIGVDSNTLGDRLREVAAETIVAGPGGQERTLQVTDDPDPRAGFFYRSDQVSFAKAGIPALFVKPGVDYVTPPKVDPEEYLREHYHQVTDRINEAWDLEGAARDMRVLFRTALKVANDPEIPRWRPGNEFEAEWRKLHGRE
jgi:Zn-dependent M28 family amino/carboxypeptidase